MPRRKKPSADLTRAKATALDVPAPWERQPTDTDESWEAFVGYRDCPRPRRLIRPGVGWTNKQMEFYKDHAWRDRCIAYDRYLDAIRVQEIAEAFQISGKEVAAEHRKVLATLRDFLLREVDKLLEDSKASTASGLIKPADIIKLTEVIVKLERLEFGQSTENVAHVVEDLRNLTTEELLEVERIQAKLAAAKE